MGNEKNHINEWQQQEIKNTKNNTGGKKKLMQN